MWKKSSYSGETNCVEVDQAGSEVYVRDSKDPDGPVLVFSHDEWQAFIRGVKAEAFD
jgi:hypothetical protein